VDGVKCKSINDSQTEAQTVLVGSTAAEC